MQCTWLGTTCSRTAVMALLSPAVHGEPLSTRPLSAAQGSCKPWVLSVFVMQDEWVQTKTYVCLRNCTCPADGSPCMLEAGCSNRVSIGRAGVSGLSLFW